uniref:Mesothelin n=1 Tax=Apteryx owenii TaxID=8824 RepID=A0A8B9QCA2_APTOW
MRPAQAQHRGLLSGPTFLQASRPYEGQRLSSHHRYYEKHLPSPYFFFFLSQLSCLAKLLAVKNLTANFTGYPPDVLLFFEITPTNKLPPRLRARLYLSPEQLSSLGALVCDMEPATITASDASVLENLKLCPALSRAQQAALNAKLLGGATGYGYPSSWDLRSLQSLGPLVLSLNQTILTSVAEVSCPLRDLGVQPPFSARDRNCPLSNTPFPAWLSPDCLSAPIVASTISDPLFLISYDTSEQFDLCLSNEVLKANLAPLLEQPLTVEYLHVMKKKITSLTFQIYPEGIPEDQLKLFGQLSHQYTTEEISMWRVTSSDTLSALLDPTAGKWNAPEVKRYLDLGGTLTGSLLQQIGGRNLCNLAEDHISRITPEAIGAGQLDISSCSQAKKDQLYIKAQEAFAGQAGTRAYYFLIQPYLGRSPLEKYFLVMPAARMNKDVVNVLQKLTVMDVKNLLGVNLPDLKQAENHPSVISWIKRQDQWELDHILGIGLQGGMVEPSSTGSATPADITPSANCLTYIGLSPTLATALQPSVFLWLLELNFLPSEQFGCRLWGSVTSHPEACNEGQATLSSFCKLRLKRTFITSLQASSPLGEKRDFRGWILTKYSLH